MRPMLGHGSRACSWFLLLAAALVLAAGGTTLAADAPDVDVTGHWASPLEAGGIDLAQSGRNVRGSSSSGLHISGTIRGRHVQFTFWRGPSYAKADPEDRGSGTMDISPNGRRATSTWQSQAEGAKNRGTFVIARAKPSDAGEPPPTVEDGQQTSTELDPGGIDDPLYPSSLPALVGSQTPVGNGNQTSVPRPSCLQTPVGNGNQTPIGVGSQTSVVGGIDDPLYPSSLPALVGSQTPVGNGNQTSVGNGTRRRWATATTRAAASVARRRCASAARRRSGRNQTSIPPVVLQTPVGNGNQTPIGVGSQTSVVGGIDDPLYPSSLPALVGSQTPVGNGNQTSVPRRVVLQTPVGNGNQTPIGVGSQTSVVGGIDDVRYPSQPPCARPGRPKALGAVPGVSETSPHGGRPPRRASPCKCWHRLEGRRARVGRPPTL